MERSRDTVAAERAARRAYLQAGGNDDLSAVVEVRLFNHLLMTQFVSCQNCPFSC